MSDLAKEVLFPGIVVLGVNAGIHAMVTGSLQGTPAYGFQTADGIAFGLEAVASGITYALAGPVPAVLGLLEAIAFAGLKLVATPAPAIVPFKPAVGPTGPTGAASQLIPGFAKVAQYAPAVDAFFKKVGIAGTVMQQMN